jgi:hypothetical protein
MLSFPSSLFQLGLVGIIFQLQIAAAQEATPASVNNQQDSGLLSVEFDSHILPIFRERCFECHAENENDGDLRLDSEESVRLGGHTGRSLLTDSPDSSELYLRLISTDKSYRMPKGSDPLPQNEIDMIRLWIEQGSIWGATGAIQTGGPALSDPSRESPTTGSNSTGIVDWLGGQINSISTTLSKPRYHRLQMVGWLLTVWISLALCGYVRYRRQVSIRTNRVSNQGVSQPDSSCKRLNLLGTLLGWRFLGIAMVVIAGLAILLLQQGIVDELQDQLRIAESKVRKQIAVPITTDRQALVLPVYPFHPPRLGGTYYRGNDERSPELFNGGVYRTATMELSLVDQNYERLEWGTDISQRSLAIQLTIQRAPRTTGALFNSEIFKQTYLRRFRETELTIANDEEDESVEVPMTAIDPNQEWRVILPLEPISQWKSGKNAGVAYLFYGSQMTDGFRGRVHYGIRYEIQIENNRISDQSVLWMGSMYDLGGRVLVPQEKEILLDHWFDYRPLPEIEFDNPDDPDLLGIPEHWR